MYENDIFEYIRQKYNVCEIWKEIKQLYKFDAVWNILETHNFNKNYFVSNLGRFKCNDNISNNKFDSNKLELVNSLTDVNLIKTRFKRHQIVSQIFLDNTYKEGFSPDHINRFERFDNSVYNLRWADRDTQCNNRTNISKRNKEVLCINNGEVYRSCTDAEKSLDLTHNTVAPVARGDKKSVFGFKFRYIM